MNKTFISITFITLVINTTSSFNSLLTGMAQQERWRVILSGISLTLIVAAGTITAIYYFKQKAKQAI